MPLERPRTPLPRARPSLALHIVAIIVIVALVVPVTVFSLHRSVLVETAVAAGILLVGQLCYFTTMLYHGVVTDGGVVRWSLKTVQLRDVTDAVSSVGVDLPGIELPDLDGEGILAAIVGVVLGIVAVVVLLVVAVLLVWLGCNVVIVTGTVLAMAVYYIFRRSIRAVLVYRRRCQGNWLRSLAVALRFAAGYTLFLAGLIWLGDWLARNFGI